MPRSTQTLIIKWTSTRSLFYAIKYHKADNKVGNISPTFFQKQGYGTGGRPLFIACIMARMFQKDSDSTVKTGNISSTVYAASSPFISALFTCCWKSRLGCLAGVGNVLFSSASLRLRRSLATSLNWMLCLWRWRGVCGLGTIYTLQWHFYPFAQLIWSNGHTSTFQKTS